MRRYHHLYIPAPDIFSFSGSDVFNHLARQGKGRPNLVVVPMEFVDELELMQEKSYGASDALLFLKGIRASTHSEGIRIGRVNDGLDIAIISRAGEFSPERLEERVRSSFTLSNDAKPTFVTNRARDHLELADKGICVEDPDFLQVSADIVHEGIILGNDALLAALRQSGDKVSLEQAADLLGRGLYINQFVKFIGPRDYEYARVHADLGKNHSGTRIISVRNPQLELLVRSEYGKEVHVGNHRKSDVLGVRPRDMEQYLAFQYGLLDPEVSLFFLCGMQGCGKTLLAYVAAVDQILWYEDKIRELRGHLDEGKSGRYKQIVLLKPNEIMGGKRRDVGALPGSLLEKLGGHLDSYNDAHEQSVLGNVLPFEEMFTHPRYANGEFNQRSKEASSAKIAGQAYLPANVQAIKMTYSGFMRGRSFLDTLILVDEAQNFTPYEVKTIIERAGEGSKIVIMGDPLQTDNPHCSRGINGLTHAIRYYLDKPYSALVTLTKSHRSQMSEDAAELRVFSS